MSSGEYRAMAGEIGGLGASVEHLARAIQDQAEQRREWERQAHQEEVRRAKAEAETAAELRAIGGKLVDYGRRLEAIEDSLLMSVTATGEGHPRHLPRPADAEKVARTGLWGALARAAALVGSALAGWLTGRS